MSGFALELACFALVFVPDDDAAGSFVLWCSGLVLHGRLVSGDIGVLVVLWLVLWVVTRHGSHHGEDQGAASSWPVKA